MALRLFGKTLILGLVLSSAAHADPKGHSSTGNKKSKKAAGDVKTSKWTEARNQAMRSYRQTEAGFGVDGGKVNLEIKELGLNLAISCQDGSSSKSTGAPKLSSKARASYFKGDTYTIVTLDDSDMTDVGGYKGKDKVSLTHTLGHNGSADYATDIGHAMGEHRQHLEGTVSQTMYCQREPYMTPHDMSCTFAIDNKTGNIQPVMMGDDGYIAKGADGQLLVGHQVISKALATKEKGEIEKEIADYFSGADEEEQRAEFRKNWTRGKVSPSSDCSNKFGRDDDWSRL